MGPELTAQSCPVVAQAQQCSEHFVCTLSFNPYNDPNEAVSIIPISQLRKLDQRGKMISPQPHSIKWHSWALLDTNNNLFQWTLPHRSDVLRGGCQASLEGTFWHTWVGGEDFCPSCRDAFASASWSDANVSRQEGDKSRSLGQHLDWAEGESWLGDEMGPLGMGVASQASTW